MRRSLLIPRRTSGAGSRFHAAIRPATPRCSAFFTYGEGYHNFHHRFPSDYRNGIRWYQWDPTKWLVASLSSIGFTSHLHRVPDHLILRARMEVEALEAEKPICFPFPRTSGTLFANGCSSARQQLEKALHQWGESVARYRDAKKRIGLQSRAEVLSSCKQKIEEYEGAPAHRAPGAGKTRCSKCTAKPLKESFF